MKVVAWSLTPDPSLRDDAEAWASGHGHTLLDLIEEERYAFRGQYLREGWTMKILGHLDNPKVQVVTRTGWVDHPTISRRVPCFSLACAPPEASAHPKPKKSATLGQRLSGGRKSGAAKGFFQSGPAPYGYRRDYASRPPRLVPHPDEAAVVRLLFRTYLRCKSLKKACAELNTLGLETRRGKRWSRYGVCWVLRNPVYIGKVRYADIRTQGVHEGIVGAIMFNKANQMLRRNDKKTRKKCTS